MSSDLSLIVFFFLRFLVSIHLPFSLSAFVTTRNRFKRLIICDKDGYYNILWLYAAYLYAKRFADDFSKR